jgi:hypothetical protein
MLVRPTPQVLEECAARLASVASAIEASRPEWPHLVGNREAAAEALLVRRALSHARRLLQSSAQFHSGWQRLLAVLTGGYRPDGSVAELTAPCRIVAQG